jgi:RimJ/RimL family protein N-acetyltransferase
MGTIDFPNGFESERLRMERLERHHLPELRRMHCDEAVMRHLGGVRDEAQTQSYLEKNLKHWAEHNFGLWIVRERSGGEPIGRALLRRLALDRVDEVEVGYAFYEPFWGCGLASEVTTTCLALGRERLGLDTIVAVTSPGNHASQHVLTKNGLSFDREFLHEGARASLFRIRWSTPVSPE